MKRLLLFLFAFLAGGLSLFGLPYIPGCPLHESCVRALRQEQRDRRRGLKNTDKLILPGAERGNGFNLGFQADLGDVLDEPILGLRPAIAWFGSFADLDIYMGVFYTINFDYPRIQRTGFQETLSYSFFPADSVTLNISVDNDNQINLSPGTVELLYAAAEPSISYIQDLPVGDITLTLAIPMGYSPEFSMDASLSLGYKFPFGLYLEAAARVWAAPELDYGETEFTLSWLKNSFYTSLTLTADKNFKTYSLEPYTAWSIKGFTLFASVLIDGIGEGNGMESTAVAEELGQKDGLTLIPCLGIKYRF
ncbi:MAG: hypothetical protein LBU18_06055 [Treponema sp.]|jgi:hypothetical protein|nr:hypothetical protein [Treponema sp.]